MRYPITIEPRTEPSEYGVVIPDLPGAFSAGETLDEAIAGGEEAGLAWIDAALDAGEAIPEPSPLESIRARPEFAGWILSLVTISPAALDDTVYRAASCGGSTRRRAPPARRVRAISLSSRWGDEFSPEPYGFALRRRRLSRELLRSIS
jgi:predicted RNase H-like HicB family nuclease